MEMERKVNFSPNETRKCGKTRRIGRTFVPRWQPWNLGSGSCMRLSLTGFAKPEPEDPVGSEEQRAACSLDAHAADLVVTVGILCVELHCPC